MTMESCWRCGRPNVLEVTRPSELYAIGIGGGAGIQAPASQSRLGTKVEIKSVRRVGISMYIGR